MEVYFDSQRHVVVVNGKPMELSTQKFNYVKLATQNGWRVVPYEELAKEIYGWDPKDRKRVMSAAQVMIGRINEEFREFTGEDEDFLLTYGPGVGIQAREAFLGTRQLAAA